MSNAGNERPRIIVQLLVGIGLGLLAFAVIFTGHIWLAAFPAAIGFVLTVRRMRA